MKCSHCNKQGHPEYKCYTKQNEEGDNKTPRRYNPNNMNNVQKMMKNIETKVDKVLSMKTQKDSNSDDEDIETKNKEFIADFNKLKSGMNAMKQTFKALQLKEAKLPRRK